MTVDKSEKNKELVRSLANTIQKKIVRPAADQVEQMNMEIQKMNLQITGLEKEHRLLAAKQRRTRLLAIGCSLGIVVLLAFQVFLFLR